ncbi:hypothetical protein HMI54_011432, partial [Coelomomyces lativittatus]
MHLASLPGQPPRLIAFFHARRLTSYFSDPIELARLFLGVRLSRPPTVDTSKVVLRWLAGITAGQHSRPDAYNQHVAILVKLVLNSWDN